MQMRTDDVSRAPVRGAALTRALAWLGPDFGLVALFTAGLVGLIAAYGGRFRWQEGPILISTAIGAGLIAARFAWRAPSIVRGAPGARAAFAQSARNIAVDWGPLILIMWLFQNLEPYTGVIRETSIDPVLYDLDVAIFGVEPSVWLSRYATPLVTDYMSLAYGLYFITPMVLATALSVRGRREEFQLMSTAVVLQLGIGFVLFLCFPAGPPRYYEPLLHGGFDPPQLQSLSGLLELQQGAFDRADPLRMRSAFPSLHCSLALITLYFSRRSSDAVFPRAPRLWGRIATVLVVSLWISVIYLRHHWAVDIAAGLALGALSLALAPVLRRRWPRRAAPRVADPAGALAGGEPASVAAPAGVLALMMAGRAAEPTAAEPGEPRDAWARR